MPHDCSSSIESASTYSPLLIHRSCQPGSSFVPPPPSGRRLNLRYAYPLVPLASLDALHTLHRHISTPEGIPCYLLTIGIARALLLFAVGCTQHWRARGGWVLVAKAVSIFMAIWEICRRVLSRNLENDGGEGLETNLIWFLVVFIAWGTAEYLVFLLLLRLSPPPRRINPLALRLPRSHTQTDMPFAFHTENAILTPGSSRAQRQMHGRNVSNISRATMRSDWSRSERGMEGEGDVFHVNDQFMEDGAGDHTGDDDEDDDEDGGEDEPGYEHDDYTSDEQDGFPEDDDDASSVSSSSIIDLPPPLSPAALSVPALPASLSISSRLGAIDRSPVIGPLVRRTRSARFLGRSWDSSVGGEVDGEAELGQAGGSVGRGRCTREMDEGYGTFND
ncbi:hypothetical protein C343_00172 [Cryptococcus neoformans C23]|uniref:Uncharacterized protein n=1 Tax=Cryptococcus neoformans (strain H99 / ATCC 208821 / CBS 10515 / FGSC 9487) TaxID=235443 RepID=J9VI73_CRYN9|nr:hypothetical protein CNAG_00173 [Cryptococcus neoformans var. grubii H99]AUB21722.1 hypothetical protein CKF44_00173 [Cryptococcus neoformans var. grubii]OWZ36894.1 hypothetical protein C347_00249 [Cryptococcus neoformans var. grubii AD2-60a]OWZ48725.1 hypothetical protein C343_00172 [Cryptococcus neoformans var. grubii C23]OXC87440.1 hypothetical protein C344_00184 [Cryptococcus neoformans var. grubii AD1-7a]OXG40451.1 hypothetical protein C360_00219 [Cryptococcus neoformans var. grubii Bt|eukprot:XP_012046582.1 hypothetical protein CNAG_00173 [Cryptococcus neoformans var. grubii H99]